MTTQTVGYKAKAFEARNLAFYFVIVLGLQWFGSALVIFGIVKIPSGIVDLGSVGLLILLYVVNFGPTIGAFVMTAIAEGKPGVRALWGRFWNRSLRFKWLIVALLLTSGFFMFRMKQRSKHSDLELTGPFRQTMLASARRRRQGSHAEDYKPTCENRGRGQRT